MMGVRREGARTSAFATGRFVASRGLVLLYQTPSTSHQQQRNFWPAENEASRVVVRCSNKFAMPKGESDIQHSSSRAANFEYGPPYHPPHPPTQTEIATLLLLPQLLLWNFYLYRNTLIKFLDSTFKSHL